MFPSGHASGTLTLAGVLFYLVWPLTTRRGPALTALASGAILTFIVGPSRIDLRNHHVGDVLAGYALGLAWLALVLKMPAPRLAREGGRSRV